MDGRRRFGTVLCAIFVLSASPAALLGQDELAAQSAMTGNEQGPLPSFSETPAGPLPGTALGDGGFAQPPAPQWTASAGCILLDRVGGVNQTLVSTYPPHNPIVVGTGTERLNSNDLNQGFSGGPDLDLIRHGDGGYDLEVSYFQIDGWASTDVSCPIAVPTLLLHRLTGWCSRPLADLSKRLTIQPNTWGGSTQRDFTMQRSTCDRISSQA